MTARNDGWFPDTLTGRRLGPIGLDPCSGIGRFGLRKREALARAEVEWDAAGVLERFRFTDQAAKVMTRAQQEARSSASGAVETEHELLALLGVRDGLAAEVFGEFGITIDPVRALVMGRLRPVPEHPIQGQVPFSALAKNVLEVARGEALSAGSQSIDAEHLLLGIVALTVVPARSCRSSGPTPRAFAWRSRTRPRLRSPVGP